jgi:hypothetical protein
VASTIFHGCLTENDGEKELEDIKASKKFKLEGFLEDIAAPFPASYYGDDEDDTKADAEKKVGYDSDEESQQLNALVESFREAGNCLNYLVEQSLINSSIMVDRT